ncbi:hypothetical protein R69608_01420 [Paraburkholderia nemoris]|uniref:hypothetical protein n=1 Tax=Paraburkholderia nemoris TaxID=2793076 RepID=UPI001912DBA0|nr:hypothetical protein [Paraburkholderia nemoris]MBK5148043.1 hypothetical protein [Burkholderia sp. R-69608]CAE6876170.1 hypothetical protein R69608_01420 [Paraburkholderia nemoris]
MATRQRYWEVVSGLYPEDPPRERLTATGVEYLVRNKVPPPRDDARADSGDGLHMVEKMDESNRPIRTFELAPGATKRSTWMAPYCGEMFEQQRICKTPQTPQQQAAWVARRVTAEQLASGDFQLPEV